MIVDSFIFLNELDLLEIRLEELYPVVDVFVLVESLKTFSNEDKPLFYGDNKKRFLKYSSKIQHVVLTDLPQGDNPWYREVYQRKVALKVLRDYPKDSLCMMSDVDEIPKKESIEKSIKILNDNPNSIGMMYMYFCHGYVNQIMKKENNWLRWGGTRFAFSQNWTEDKSGREAVTNKDLIIKDAGWHFRNILSPEELCYKLKSYSHFNDEHCEGELQKNLDVYYVKKRIEEGKELCENGYTADVFPDELLPDFLKNKKEFKKNTVYN